MCIRFVLYRYYWVEHFAKCRTNSHNSEWSSWPSDPLNDETINILWALLAEDRRYTLDDMRYKIATEHPYVISTFHNHLFSGFLL